MFKKKNNEVVVKYSNLTRYIDKVVDDAYNSIGKCINSKWMYLVLDGNFIFSPALGPFDSRASHRIDYRLEHNLHKNFKLKYHDGDFFGLSDFYFSYKFYPEYFVGLIPCNDERYLFLNSRKFCVDENGSVIEGKANEEYVKLYRSKLAELDKLIYDRSYCASCDKFPERTMNLSEFTDEFTKLYKEIFGRSPIPKNLVIRKSKSCFCKDKK